MVKSYSGVYNGDFGGDWDDLKLWNIHFSQLQQPEAMAFQYAKLFWGFEAALFSRTAKCRFVLTCLLEVSDSQSGCNLIEPISPLVS